MHSVVFNESKSLIHVSIAGAARYAHMDEAFALIVFPLLLQRYLYFSILSHKSSKQAPGSGANTGLKEYAGM